MQKIKKRIIYLNAFVFVLIMSVFFNTPQTSAAAPPPSIDPGDIIINEIMKDPSAVDDSKGEWFEIYNTTGSSIDLNGCVISDIGTNTHTIATSTIILSNNYAILGIEDDILLNGGVSIDYEYSNFTLANADDEIILTCDSVEIDKVEYDDGPNFPDPTGKSMILADFNLDNNIGHNWCESSSTYGSGDKGTPGSANDSCYAIVSGYKYEDLDNNTSTTEYLSNPIADWQIYLFDSFNQTTTTATTTAGGYFEFNQLLPGDYTVSEELQNDWTALTSTSANIFLPSNTTSTNNFINYYNPPGWLEIYKYEDEDGDIQTTNDQTLATSTIWSFIIDSGTATTTVATTDNGCVTKTLDTGEYIVTEEILNDWFAISPTTGATTTEIITGATTTINFYNTGYSTISGYKYEDLDNNTSTTEYLDNPVIDWEINLLNLDTQTTSTATTSDLGYFEFTSLVPGDYTVSEELQDNWLALFPTSTSFTLLSNTATSTYFVNYFKGGSGGEDPEEKPEKDSPSGGGGGSGGFIQRPEAELELIYPYDKYLDEQYYETIVVSNSGNIILNNGVLKIDLPEDKLKFISAEPAWSSIDSITGLATWDIPTLTVNDAFLVKIIIRTLLDGEAITDVSAVFGQTSTADIMTEDIIFVNGTGGGPEEEEVVAAPEETPTSPPADPGEGTVAGTGEVEEEPIPSTRDVPQVKGEQVYELKNGEQGCSKSTWWHWLLVILFLAGLNFTYYFMLREDE